MQLEQKIDLVPGDIFIKHWTGSYVGPPVGLGAAWRITRTRVADSNSGAERFKSMLPDGVIYDSRLTSGNPGLLHLPNTGAALGRFRAVTAITGTID